MTSDVRWGKNQLNENTKNRVTEHKEKNLANSLSLLTAEHEHDTNFPPRTPIFPGNNEPLSLGRSFIFKFNKNMCVAICALDVWLSTHTQFLS